MVTEPFFPTLLLVVNIKPLTCTIIWHYNRKFDNTTFLPYTVVVDIKTEAVFPQYTIKEKQKRIVSL